MKKYIRLLMLLGLSLAVHPIFGQTGFSYQAVARNADGSIMKNETMTIRISILDAMEEQIIWRENHDVQTNEYGLFTLHVGGNDAYNQTGTVKSFIDIDWSAASYNLNVQLDEGNTYTDLGTSPILTVPMASYAKNADFASSAGSGSGKFSVQADAPAGEGEALFEVRRADGSVAFAVYEDMVWVFVDTTETKGVKGGFAVGGYNSAKGPANEYLRITPDSIRMYINTDPAKGKKGGFAVGGYNSAKAMDYEFLRVTPDSTRIYVNADPAVKARKGGFAVGGYSSGKALNDDFLYVSGNENVDIVNNKAQILWYPLKEAFLAGNIYIPHPDSVGQNSTSLGYQSLAPGDWSQAFGFRSRALGDYSTAIGREARAGFSSFAFGNRADASGNISYALGSRAEASGPQSFALGVSSVASTDYAFALGFEAEASGEYATAIGFRSAASGNSSFSAGRMSEATAQNSIAFGNGAISSGLDAAAMGFQSQALGEKSIAIGSHFSYTFNNLPYFNFGKGGNETKDIFDFIILPPVILPEFRTITFNRENIAEGKYSISIGNGNYSNLGGMALGSNNDANGFGAVALGLSNKALNTNALAGGYNSDATGYYSSAIGNNVSAKAYGSFVIGQYNLISGDSARWVNTDPLFIVGNGINEDNRNNALTIYKNGRSIFKGEDANLTLNDRRVFINPFTFESFLNVYGVRSYINRSNPDVDNYYSGYFFDTGAEGNYQGFYADTRSGGSIDVAEYIYDTHGTTNPGDVLIADPDAKESVIVSSQPYQTSVVGVVSTDPHLVMGMELVMDEETGTPIPNVQATRLALTGRVPCKVTDENGPIQPGDMVTTSSTAGHAMKWTLLDVNEAVDFEELKSMIAVNESRRNAVIGKALESHESGSGTIMVLISLQ